MSKRRLFGREDEEAQVPEDQASTTRTALDQPGVTGNEPSAGTLVARAADKSLADRQADRDKADLETAPQYVKDAAARMGGDVPRAAPKATDGVRATGDTLTDAPELAPPPPPAEFRAAPTAPGPVEREDWPDGEALSLEDADQAGQLRVRTRDSGSAGIHVGGTFVTAQGGIVNVATVRNRSEAHLRALLTDPRIQVTRK